VPDSHPENPLQVALISRELYPFGGGGMGNYVAWTAQALAEVAAVTIVTTDRHEESYRRLRARGDPRIDPRIRYVFAPDFDYEDHRTFYGYFHRWSASVFETLAGAFPGGGPDLVEFAEYHGEGAVTIQARRTADPRVRNTLVCVRINSSSELVLTLDGSLEDDFRTRAMFELERYSLRFADRVIWPGGDVLATYRRFYGPDAVAPTERIRHAVTRFDDAAPTPRPRNAWGGEHPLRLLYMGRLERRKGIHNLIRALLSLERQDWTLTVLGRDTPTGPLGVSMRGRLELMLDGDPRIRFLDHVPRERVLELVAEHDLCVVPSLWECWPNVVLEAYLRGRPVLATPTGGLVEMVRHGSSGFLTEGTDPESVAVALERILDGRDDLARLEPRELRRVFDELTDTGAIRDRYLILAGEARARRPAVAAEGDGRRAEVAPPAAADRPLVSIVLTYYRLADYVSETVESLVAQTYSPVEVILVNDGSFEPEDAIVQRLAERHGITVVAQPNSGLSAARNLGISQAAGDLVMPFDADDVAEPRLVERCVEALLADPSPAYVTTWSTFVDENGEALESGHGYEPLGNWSRLLAEQNVAGGCVALIRREYFDRGLRFDPELTSYEDWDLYRQLAEAGLHGHVIPERLYRYRLRRSSMVRVHGVPELRRHRNEMAARERERSIEWTQSSA
jgi:glycogen(starch) synthase